MATVSVAPRATTAGVAATTAGPGAGAGERYVDRGPGKREWSFTVVAFNSMQTYAGTPSAMSAIAKITFLGCVTIVLITIAAADRTKRIGVSG